MPAAKELLNGNGDAEEIVQHGAKVLRRAWALSEEAGIAKQGNIRDRQAAAEAVRAHSDEVEQIRCQSIAIPGSSRSLFVANDEVMLFPNTIEKGKEAVMKDVEECCK
jgi:hypothetical protein